MNISLWNKRDPLTGELARLRDEVDRTFDRFFKDPGLLGGRAIDPLGLRAETWVPPLDVSETDSEVTIRAEVPGVPTKDLDITVSGHTLNIAGKKEEHEEKQTGNVYRSERRFGSFFRSIDLPDTVDTDRITAESDNGIVTLHAAKKPGAKPRHVDIKPMNAPSRKVPVTT
ncbi:MAG: Hsp20/alpha crystallin family protein [Phycisphaerales bacterium]|nr:Hsp20/alpha crystallin family protein [Phycisphaerales bacterium]